MAFTAESAAPLLFKKVKFVKRQCRKRGADSAAVLVRVLVRIYTYIYSLLHSSIFSVRLKAAKPSHERQVKEKEFQTAGPEI